MPNTAEDIYLGRQPILDREQRIHAFELLFRSSLANRAVIVDDQAATSAVIIHTLSEFGTEAVLGEHTGLINCNLGFLMSDAVEILPAGKMVLEILESTPPTDAVLRRCADLKNRGFRFALDDFRGCSDTNRPFLPLADIIKVDIFGMTGQQLQQVTREIAGLPAIRLAEKVESEEEFHRCLALGYQLFQGYFFSRPEVVTGKRMSQAHATLIRLLALIQQDAELSEIAEVFKQHPTLSVNLLRLANSAATGLRSTLKSIDNAIVVLGRRQLQRWLLLMMLADGCQGAGNRSLLLHLAATRGKFMELMAVPGAGGSAFAESAFIVGIVSMMDAVLGMPLEKVVASLGLSSDVSGALLAHEGPLGELLILARALETDDADAVAAFIARHPGTGTDLLNRSQGQALAWANRILLSV